MIECPGCKMLGEEWDGECAACHFKTPSVDNFVVWAPELMSQSDGFEPEYFGALSKLEGQNFWFRSRNALIQWAIRRYFTNALAFLEVGCGTGYVASGISGAFPQMRIVGSEVLVAGLHFAKQRVPNAIFCQMDARDIPYVSEFDLVGAFDVIEHIEQDQLVLENLYRTLKPNGGLIICVPQHQWLWGPSDEYARHVRRYEAQALALKVRSAGFEIVRSTSFVSVLLPALIFSRRCKATGAAYDPLNEFRIGALVNHLMEAMLTFERWLIQLGVNFPVGGSRMLIAKKPG